MARAAESARWEGIAQQWADASDAAARAQDELNAKFQDTSLVVQNLGSLMQGALGNEMANNAKTTEDLAARQAELRGEIEKLQKTDGQYWQHVENSNVSAAERNLALLQYADAQKRLAEETDPMKQAQLQVQMERLQQTIADVDVVTSGYVDNSKRIGELTSEYDDVTLAIQNQEKEHTLATRRILFNILQQQIANLGLTAEAGPQLIEIAKRWGLIDEATANATQGMLQALQDTANSGDWANLVGNADAVRLAMEGIKPVHTTIEIETRWTTTGQPPAAAGDVGIQTWTPPKGTTVTSNTGGSVKTEDQYGNAKAFGGPVSAGGTYLWQESVFSRPEVFVPGTSGAVLTRQQAESMFGANGGPNGEIAAAIRSIPRVVAREIKTAVQFALVRGG